MDQNQPSKHKYKPAACPMLLRSTCYPEGLDSWVFLKYRGTTKGCETQPFINCPESLQFLLVKYGWLCLTGSPTMAGLLCVMCHTGTHLTPCGANRLPLCSVRLQYCFYWFLWLSFGCNFFPIQVKRLCNVPKTRKVWEDKSFFMCSDHHEQRQF